jgi:hypothetical protein
VVWRVIGKVYFKSGLIGEFNHSLQESCSPTATFRAVVHIYDKPPGSNEFLLARVPPKFDAINDEVAGLVAFGEKQKCFATVGFQDASRHKFFFGHHLVVECLDWCCATRPAATRIVTDMDCRFCIKTYANSIWLRVRTGIYRADVFKDLVGPFCFF